MGLPKHKEVPVSKPLDIKNLILLFMVTVYPLIVIPNPVGYSTLPRYIVLTILSLVTLYSLAREKVILRHPCLIPLLLFFSFMLISTVLAHKPAIAFIGSPNRFTGLSTYFFCIVLFLAASASSNGQKLLHCLIGSAAIVSILAVLQYFGIDIVPHNPKIDFTGSDATIGNPNFLGTYTAFILPASILVFLQNNRLHWLFCAATIYAGLLVCLTRGVWLASGVTFLIIAFYVLKNSYKLKSFGVIVLVFIIITAALLPVQDGLLLNRLFSISGEVESAVQLEGNAGTFRMFIWQETIKLLPQYWAFGMGPDNLMYADIHTPNNTLVDKVHNIYLEIAVTMGVFAFLSYIGFLICFLNPRKNEIGFVFFIMILTYLIQGLFNIDVISVLPLFWIVLGLSLANIKATEEIP